MIKERSSCQVPCPHFGAEANWRFLAPQLVGNEGAYTTNTTTETAVVLEERLFSLKVGGDRLHGAVQISGARIQNVFARHGPFPAVGKKLP